jgi:PAS domain-containing protein
MAGPDAYDPDAPRPENSEALEAALLQSEQRYRSLFQESRDAIYITKPDGRLLEVNPSFVDMFGYSRAELLKSTRPACMPIQPIVFVFKTKSKSTTVCVISK